MNRPEESETESEERPLFLLDACCAINLLASGEARAILRALETVNVAVASFVAEQEVVEVAPATKEEMAEEDLGTERTEANLTLDPLIEEGLLDVVCPEGEQEEATYVDLALQLDDGEAMTGAIAIHRAGTVATDDKKAIRVLGAQRSSPQIRRTSWLIRTWAQAAEIDHERLQSVLRNIERRGSFVPPLEDPLLGWWLRVTERDYLGGRSKRS